MEGNMEFVKSQRDWTKWKFQEVTFRYVRRFQNRMIKIKKRDTLFYFQVAIASKLWYWKFINIDFNSLHTIQNFLTLRAKFYVNLWLISLPDLCLMKHLSDGESSLIKNRNSSKEALGIFQISISSCGWKTPHGLCNIQCKSNSKRGDFFWHL